MEGIDTFTVSILSAISIPTVILNKYIIYNEQREVNLFTVN